MENWGLERADVEKIKGVFPNYPLIEKVLIYGSRAMGNYKPSSDIDLTLIGENLNSNTLQSLEFDLDDLMLPYKFDISIFDKITNMDFMDHINRVGKRFYLRE